jgi:hypothetical protein
LTYVGVGTKVKFCDCWRSSGVEQLPCKQWVGGSNPPASARHFSRLRSHLKGLQSEDKRGDTQVGQRGQTVNLLANAFGGSNPPLPTIFAGEPRRVERERGNSSAVERQPSKLGVAGSNPVSRSTRPRASRASAPAGEGRQDRTEAHVAQLAEHALGKGEVSGSIPDMGSILRTLGERQRD